MHFDKHRISRILHTYKDVFDTLEQYDKTREWPLGRTRLDITLSKRTIKKLKELKEKRKKPISHLIEEAVERL